MDRLDQLDAVVRRNGAVLATGRLNPALVESRQQQLVLGRLVAQLDLWSADQSPAVASISDAARDIASARWRKQGSQCPGAGELAQRSQSFKLLRYRPDDWSVE